MMFDENPKNDYLPTYPQLVPTPVQKSQPVAPQYFLFSPHEPEVMSLKFAATPVGPILP